MSWLPVFRATDSFDNWSRGDDLIVSTQAPRADELGQLPPAGPLSRNSVALGTGRPVVAEYVTDDPQVVPAEILHRSQAADPVKVTLSPVWTELAAARTGGSAAEAIQSLRELRGSASYVSNPPAPRPWPPVKASAPAAEKPAAAKPAAQLTTLVRRIRRAVKNRL